MSDQCEIMTCALGDVWLCSSGIQRNYLLLVGPDGPIDNFIMPDGPLPGGKFTAREFLEAYLTMANNMDHAIRSVVEDIGTWHFTAEAVRMAKDALEEWGK